MKATFYTFLLCITQISSYSQTVLQASDINPVVGDYFHIISGDFAGLTGSTGANQSWILSFGPSFTSDSYTAYATTGTFLPSASVRLYPYVEKFFGATPDSLTLLGLGETWDSTVFADNEKLLKYPFQMGDSFTDTWAYSSGTPVNYKKGTNVVVADGYGTLDLPNGVHSNVLRVKTTKNYLDSVNGNVTYTFVKILYEWYKPGSHIPIATLDSTTTNGLTTQVKVQYLENIANSVKENNREEIGKLTISPIPATHSFRISMEKELSNASFSLSDITGKIQKIEVISNTNGEYTIIPFATSEGVYFLTVFSDGNAIAAEKIQLLN